VGEHLLWDRSRPSGERRVREEGRQGASVRVDDPVVDDGEWGKVWEECGESDLVGRRVDERV
jgi:hypothetical protein